jgi:hypothetical protein
MNTAFIIDGNIRKERLLNIGNNHWWHPILACNGRTGKKYDDKKVKNTLHIILFLVSSNCKNITKLSKIQGLLQFFNLVKGLYVDS